MPLFDGVVNNPPPSSGTNALWVPAIQFTSTTGTPTLSAVNRWPAWLLDAAATEIVTAVFGLPANWVGGTFNVDLWWTNAGAGAGDARLRYSEMNHVDGATVTLPATVTNLAFTAPAQSVIEVTAIAAGRTAAAGLYAVEMDRRGADASDTLANDIACFGLMLSKAT